MTEAEKRRQARRGAAGQNLRILGEPTKDLKANDTRSVRGKTQYYNPETKKFQNRRYVAKAPGEVTESQKRNQENEDKRAAANKARKEGKLSNIPPNREQLAIDQDDTFAGFDAMNNRTEVTQSDFKPAPMTTKELLGEIDTVMAEPDSLNDVLAKSLQATDQATAGATNSTMQDQLRETSGRLEQLRILQEGGVKTGPQGMLKIDGGGFASVNTAAGNKALKKQLARLKAQKLAQLRIG